MKTHQILAIVATMVIAMTGAAFSADADKVVTYEVGMTGVTWNGCKASVSSAFKGLEGVKTVEIKAGKKAGTQLVVVTGTKPGLTKEQAVKSLGDKAQRFVVQDWKEVGADKKKSS